MIVAGCLGLILLIIAISFVNAWVLMLLWGAIAPQFDHSTIGFGTAYLICLALGFVGGFFRNATHAEGR